MKSRISNLKYGFSFKVNLSETFSDAFGNCQHFVGAQVEFRVSEVHVRFFVDRNQVNDVLAGPICVRINIGDAPGFTAS